MRFYQAGRSYAFVPEKRLISDTKKYETGECLGSRCRYSRFSSVCRFGIRVRNTEADRMRTGGCVESRDMSAEAGEPDVRERKNRAWGGL